ncbi:hypothetical protein ASPACDRAFT_1887155 [Aspergillus aculeatus ATCC 16872]|uniref:F-box domain-containing protein n=1 Tax=Aspergillus aculeatus (strain ATCC 16872 / CBS 172.66 / WB 5094) TaxID=690307 RepID=A0A1L9WZ25_ASPA1|nr:uncharacterized protein ASPACDRAFT_1887155 [Aspergillus aculeatus ATCC 16872]OJK01502.1 hypothetical protein ASPACDRAFT_1887155 [Aspergillus aculeatus ATCC 16872]
MESLPPELFDAIATHLAFVDWCALRLTCKALYRAIWPVFARRYFQRIHVMVTPEGIADLKALASHETIRPVVQDLCLIPPLSRNYNIPLAEFTEVLRSAPERRDWTSEEIQAHYTVYKATHTAHLTFAQSESLVSSLAECLAQFDNLRSRSLYEPLAFCLRDLRVLEVCLGPGSPEGARDDCLPGLITRAAPTLRTLKLFQWAQMQESSPDVFADLAPQVQFSRLVRLHLHWVEVTQSDFALFLRSAAPSLRMLTLVALSLKDPLPDGSECIRVLTTIWRNFRNILQETIPAIHVFAMTWIACRRHQLRFAKSCRKNQSASPATEDFSYHANRTPATFADWLNTLDLDPETPLARDLPALSRGSHSLYIGTRIPNLGDELNEAAAVTFELGSP